MSFEITKILTFNLASFVFTGKGLDLIFISVIHWGWQSTVQLTKLYALAFYHSTDIHLFILEVLTLSDMSLARCAPTWGDYGWM